MSGTQDFTLAELLIAAASEAWRGDGEVLASGIGTIPRIAAGLAKLTHGPALMMTDGEAYLVEDPTPLGPRAEPPKHAGWMPFSRIFDCVWHGRRHAMVGPTQIDRWGQSNISCLGGDFRKPKVQMLGVRGFPGNSVNHANSMFVPSHGRRVFVEGEVDMVAGVGYNPKRWPEGARGFVDLRLIVTDLCVLDFQGPDHAIRVRSLHPGVTFDEVQAATGFPLHRDGESPVTAAPTEEQLAIIRRLDPQDLRAGVLRGNPPGVKAPA